MISQQALNRTQERVQQAIAEGAELVAGGERSELGEQFYQPTLLRGVTQQMAIARQELFAPVSLILSFDDEASAIAMANDTEYGLAAYLYARDIGRVWRLARQLKFGMLGVNDSQISNVAAPFGGVKQSGFGREGSTYGLDDYLDLKYVSIAGLSR